MKLKEFREKEEIKDFLEGVIQQLPNNMVVSDTTFEKVVTTMYNIMSVVEKLDKTNDPEIVSKYITTCLAVYITLTYESANWTMDIKPTEDLLE